MELDLLLILAGADADTEEVTPFGAQMIQKS
jgi:hypothetical protein